MSRIVDVAELGVLPLQNFGFAEEGLDTDQRWLPEAVRIRKRDLLVHKLGHFEVVEETGGKFQGAMVWLPEEEGIGEPRLFTSNWQAIWPAISAPKETENRLSATEGNQHASEDEIPPIYPIFNRDFEADTRYAKELPFLAHPDECFPKPAGGMRGLVLDAVIEDSQQPLWIWGDPRLVAAHHGKRMPESGEFSSLVVDLNPDDEIDPLRCARISTFFQVVKDPNHSCSDYKGENTISHMITDGLLDDVHGGLWTDLPSTLIGGTATGAAPAAGVGMTTTGPNRVHATYSIHDGGPLVAGRRDDQHRIGQDGDQIPINVGHLSLDTLWWGREGQVDAPWKFDGDRKIPDGSPSDIIVDPPFMTKVFYFQDPKADHQNRCKGGKGLLHWMAKTQFLTITNGSGVPPDKPPDDGGGVPNGGDKGGGIETGDRRQPGGAVGVDPDIFTPTGEPTDFSDPPRISPFTSESRPTCETVTATMRECGCPSYDAIPQFTKENYPDLSCWTQPTAQLIDQHFKTAPVTGKLEAFGNQRDDRWDYTQQPRKGRYVGGTANGGFALLNPERTMANFMPGAPNLDEIEITPSKTYLVATRDTFLAVANPDLETGEIKDGVRWGVDSVGSGVFTVFAAAAPLGDDVARLGRDLRFAINDTVDSSHWGAFATEDLTADRTWTFQDGNGTVAFLSDITAGGNTLDDAYDQGGAGAGRTITADAGSVAILGADGLTVGAAAISAEGERFRVSQAAGVPAAAEVIALFDVDDVVDDWLKISNQSAVATEFAPRIHARNEGSTTLPALQILAEVDAANDSGTVPILDFQVRRSNGLQSTATRPVARFTNFGAAALTIFSAATQFPAGTTAAPSILPGTTGSGMYSGNLLADIGRVKIATESLNRLTFGDIGDGEVAFNEDQHDYNHRIAGAGDVNLLTADAGLDRVGVGVAPAAHIAKLDVQQESTTGALPVLHLDQQDISEEAIRFTGEAASAVLTQTLVATADVATFTVRGYLKINIQDEGNQITDGPYFIAFGDIA